MRIQIVDAFTAQPFAGNPAGVVVLPEADFPGAEWMQRVASEVNLSETAFLHPLPPGAEADFALRWFTPVLEVALCGHATLASRSFWAPSDASTLRVCSRATGIVTFWQSSPSTEPDGLITRCIRWLP